MSESFHAFQQEARTVAGYLRCYPHDQWGMPAHHRVVEVYAQTIGYLAGSDVYFDNGAASWEEKESLDLLLDAIRAGQYTCVVVPGLWVFSIHDAEARDIRDRINAMGCEVAEVPRGKGNHRSYT
ncbi:MULTISPECIES: hypothetical protein [Streptomyces]|uniref:hypothetical protein n=1 Tax=Streptomyces TaxID=1883 RepID=UPI0015875EFE|nr:hypothetical protein [Streptomyces sp. CAI-85]MBO7937609.1 hypothetical protein [Streptomyces sp. S9]NUV59268.1 hypothetical protein [Streptomyces sp. CAI-85]